MPSSPPGSRLRCSRSTTTPSARSTATCSPAAATGRRRGRHVRGVHGRRRRRPARHRADVTTAWLIGIARHKLVDHWRRSEREQRRAAPSPTSRDAGDDDDPWDAHLDVLGSRDASSSSAPTTARRSRCATSTASGARGRRRARPHRRTPPRPCSCGPGGRSARLRGEVRRDQRSVRAAPGPTTEPARPDPGFVARLRPPRRRPRRGPTLPSSPFPRGAPP